MHRLIALAALTMGAPMCAHQPSDAPESAADAAPGEFVIRSSPSAPIESDSLPDSSSEAEGEDS